MMDKNIWSLPYETKNMTSQQNPASLDYLVSLVDSQRVMVELLRSTRVDPEGNCKSMEEVPKARRTHELEGSRRRQPHATSNVRLCFQCGEPGHISWDCPGKDEPMFTAAFSGARPCHVLDSYWVQETSPAHRTPVKVDGRDTQALVDSGSVVSLVQPNLLEPSGSGKVVPVSCVHGDIKEYPTSIIQLTPVKGNRQLKVEVVPPLPVPVLVGRYCPLYHRPSHLGQAQMGGTKELLDASFNGPVWNGPVEGP